MKAAQCISALERGEAVQAEGALSQALAGARTRVVGAQARIGLGDCAFVRDDYASAVTHYQRALDLNVPDARNDYALYRCGVARQRLGGPAE